MRTAAPYKPLRLPPGSRVTAEAVNRNLDEIEKAIRASCDEFRSLAASSRFAVANYDELRKLAGRVDKAAYVAGRVAANDGGEGVFVWRIGSAADNGGTIIAGPAGSGGYWAREFVKIVKPAWFGCLFNGTVQLAELQAATYAAAGLTLELPEGECLTNGRWLIPSNITIRSPHASEATRVKLADGAVTGATRNGALLTMVQIKNATNVTLEGFELHGNKANNPDTANYYFAGGVFIGQRDADQVSDDGSAKSTFVTLRNMYIHDTLGNGVAARGAEDISVIDCDIEYSGDTTDAGPWNCIFAERTTRCHAFGGTAIGGVHGDIECWTDLSTEHTIHNMKRVGVVSINGAVHHTAKINILNNVFNDSESPATTTGACLSVNLSSEVLVANNTFSINTTAKRTAIASQSAPGGVWVTGDPVGKALSFVNNRIKRELTSSGGDFSAFEIQDAQGVDITGNQIEGVWDRGIVLDRCHHSTIARNDIFGDRTRDPADAAARYPAWPGTGILLVRSSRTRIAHNTIRGLWFGIAETDAPGGGFVNTGAAPGSTQSIRNVIEYNDTTYVICPYPSRGPSTIYDGSVQIATELRGINHQPATETLAGIITMPKGIKALGKTTAGDGGGGDFQWIADTATADDGTNNFVPTDLPRTGLWRRTGQCRGETDIASASTISPPAGDFHKITGGTAVNYISTARAYKGQYLRFYVTNAAGLTWNNNAGAVPAGTASILTKTGANVAVAQRDTFGAVYDGTNWLHV